ncbi:MULTISPECIES: GntR family transcriptional regulator [unclassified Streptomyces]|uniref:GntR family transcriptional regulator n=1 Tax=unclassified Streptomyces TaxID=2593676 RepID=UPI002E2DF34B|nr:substrate-binding domain-containing protein [Streptomyces sp. NBC_00223]
MGDSPRPGNRRRGSGSVRDAAARNLKFQALAADLRRGILAGDWPPAAKLPTESGLAKETGLSLTTVRRAFDLLVEEGLVVRRQGSGSFVASPRHQPPRTRRTVGVLVPDTKLYYPRVLQGIEESLSAAGVGLQLATYHYDRAEEDRDLEFLLDSGVDGLLLVPTLTGIDDPAVRAGELMALPVPAVLVERRLIGSGPGDRTEHVCSDHLGGAYDAVLHLHRLGHRRIALITRSRNPTGVAVALGFQRAMSDLGLPPGFSHEAEKAEWTPGLADRMIGDLTTSGTTAALVFGDREAILLEAAARRHGTDIPGQLALVSYDDETADIAEVPLTAVAPPKYRVGRMAAEVLLRRLTEGDACPLHQVLLRPRIVIRASCGAAVARPGA